MAPPRVSVIMPVYNGEAFIAEAIASLLGQTEPRWELIVVDDGSTDGTPAIVDAQCDDRIRYVPQAHAGRSVARNLGIDSASGDFLLFLDADDALLPMCLQTHLAYLAAHPGHDASIADVAITDPSGRIMVHVSALRRHFVPAYAEIEQAGGTILEPLLLTPVLVGQNNAVMVRASVVRERGARFVAEMTMGEDWDFWIQIAEIGQFGFIPQVLSLYRWHRQNALFSQSRESRTRSLMIGRRRVLAAPYFADLRADIQLAFYHQLLFDLLAYEPREQQDLLSQPPATSLAPAVQARLLLWAATAGMGNGAPGPFVEWCLARGARVQGANALIRGVWLMWKLHPAVPSTLRRVLQKLRTKRKAIHEPELEPGVRWFLAASQPSR